MADPLSALSLASNILQIVGFSGKIISGSSELFQSTTGALKSNEELETITNDLVTLTKKLNGLHLAQRPDSTSEEEQALHKLCTGCAGIANKLLLRLTKLKVPAGNEKKRDGKVFNTLYKVHGQKGNC